MTSGLAAAVAGAVLLPASGKSYVVLTGIAVGYAVTAAAYGLATRALARAGPPAEPTGTGTATGRPGDP